MQCQFLPEDQIFPASDNEMHKSDQLACIRYHIKSILNFIRVTPLEFMTAEVKRPFYIDKFVDSWQIFNSPEPLAHWWAYSIVMGRRPSTIFKDFLLHNRWANRSQISYRASMGWGNESLFAGSESNVQNGRHTQIW